jgi:hypothetical protein
METTTINYELKKGLLTKAHLIRLMAFFVNIVTNLPLPMKKLNNGWKKNDGKSTAVDKLANTINSARGFLAPKTSLGITLHNS